MRKLNNKGITLIALVITIIILLILAGVAIALTIGDNGIFYKAKKASNTQKYTSAYEKINLKIIEANMNKASEEGIKCTLKELEEYLRNDEEKEVIIVGYNKTENGDMVSSEIPLELINIVIKAVGYEEYLFLIGDTSYVEKISIDNGKTFHNIEEFIKIEIESETKDEALQYLQGLKYAYDMKTFTSYTEYAAEFNGTNYLQTDNIGDEYTGTNSKTLSTWFKTNIVTNRINGFSGIGTDGSKTGFLCGVKNGYLYFDTGYSNFIRSETDYVADGNWHHFIVTYDKDETIIRLYLDGKEIYTDTGVISTTDGPLLIGKSFSYCFTGSILSVRLYNRAINESEVQSLYNEGPQIYSTTSIRNGLTYEYIMKNNLNGVVTDTANSHVITQVGDISYYEKDISIIKDMSGNENDIQVDKNMLKNSEGKYYLDFYNQNKYYVTRQLESDYLSTNSKTLMSWFKTTEISNEIQGFVGIGIDGSKTGFLCGVKNGYLYFDTGYSNFIRSETDYVADGNWHHFAVTYEKDTKEIKLYLDGKKIYENVGDIDTQPSSLSIGKSFEYTFNGQVTNVRLYNICIDETVVNNIYNSEK